MGQDRDIVVADLRAAFDAIPTQGQKLDLSGDPLLEITEAHVQGIARYKNYWILSHSHRVDDHGYLLVADADTRKYLGKHATPAADREDHPGGIQLCRDYLFVACEKVADSPGSSIYMYDLAGYSGGPLPAPRKVIDRRDTRSGAVAVTSLEWPRASGQLRHLVVVLDRRTITTYLSEGGPLSAPDLHFREQFRQELPDLKVQCIALFTEWSGTISLLGLASGPEGVSFRDELQLFRVDLDAQRVEHVASKHLVTKHGAVKGVAGVHLRWGAGARATSERSLEITASQAHFTFRKLTCNTFTGTARAAPRLRPIPRLRRPVP